MKVERLLVGALVALVIGRFLVAGDDPGRQRLTSGGGPLTLNVLSFVLLFGWSLWRALYRVPLVVGPSLILVAGLLFTAIWTGISTAQPDRYRHPGIFITWDWFALTALVFVASQLITDAGRQKRLAAVLIASAGSLIVQSLYAEMTAKLGWPGPDFPATADTALVAGGEKPANVSLLTLPMLALVGPLVLMWACRGFYILPLLFVAGAYLIWAESLRHLKGEVYLTALDSDPWFGSGPGDVNRRYVLKGPIWGILGVSTGLPASLALFLSLGVCLLLVWRRRTRTLPDVPTTRTAWEFYAGGIAGLLLGMILATGDIPAEAPASELLRLGIVAAGRALVWFFVYAILEKDAIEGSWLHRACFFGLALGMFALCACNITQQTATLNALCMIVVIGLPGRSLAGPVGTARAWLAMPLALAVLAGNVLHAGWPGLVTAANVRAARAASKEYPFAKYRITGTRGADRLAAVRDAKNYLEGNIVLPLRAAVEQDPGNSTLMLELARWQRDQWSYLLELRDSKSAAPTGLRVLSLAEQAAQIDPRNREAPLSVYESLLVFTRENATASKNQLTVLDRYIRQIADREPNREFELRYRVLMTILPKENQEDIDAWAVNVFRLGGPAMKERRVGLIEALKKAVPKPSPALQKWLKDENTAER